MNRHHKGFIALIAVVLISTGTFVFSLVLIAAVSAYADSVERHQNRIQKSLNIQACKETVQLMKSKDPFVSGTIKIPEFDCEEKADP